MAQLAGKAVAAVDQLAIDHHAGANTGAECDHDEILETAGSAIGHLADSGGIGVVGDSYGNVELVAQKLGKRHGSGPGKIHSVLDHAGVIVGVGGAHTDTEDLVLSLDALYQTGDTGIELIYIVVDIGVLARFDTVRRKDHATGINNAEHRVGAAHVDTYYIWLAVYHGI